MLTQAVDVDETAARRVRPFDQKLAGIGDDSAQDEDFRDERQAVMHQKG
jgi:hypothetical protein